MDQEQIDNEAIAKFRAEFPGFALTEREKSMSDKHECKVDGCKFKTPAIRADVVGWFDAPGQTTPAHDPGTEAICPVCATKLSAPVVTVSLMPHNNRIRSYFFRAHRACWNGATERERGLIESAVIDAVSAPPSAPAAKGEANA